MSVVEDLDSHFDLPRTQVRKGPKQAYVLRAMQAIRYA